MRFEVGDRGVILVKALQLGLAMTCLAATQPGWSAPVTVPLVPQTARVGLTVYAMGMWPIAGQFDRFSGDLVMAPDDPGRCAVELDVEVGSLHMADPSRTVLALGPKLLDATRFPALHFAGTCAGTAGSGALTLHGVTRTITVSTRREGNVVRATGSVHRGDYGIDGLPGLIGRTVEMRVSITLPPGLVAQLRPG